MEQQSDLQKRLLLALTLSFIVFIAFDLFMPKTIKPVEGNTTVQAQELNSEQTAPQVSTVNNTAPITNNSANTVATVPSSTSNQPISVPMSTSTFKVLTTVESDIFVYKIDEIGRIAQATMLEKKYNYQGQKLELLNPNWVKPLEIRFSDATLNSEALKTPYTTSTSSLNLSAGSAKVTLTQKLSSTTVTKEITFYKDGHYDININLSTPQAYFIMPGRRPDADHTIYLVNQGAMLKKTNAEIHIIEDGDADERLNGVNVDFASSFDRYFASILYNFDKPLKVFTQVTKDENALVFIQGEQSFSLHGYLGPKESVVLKNIDPKLVDAIEYGVITFFAKPLFQLLEWFHDLVGNWGWAIVLVTLLIKLILFPLSYKGMMSMQKLKDLSPQMKEIKTKYGKDPQKMNMKMMEMYKKEGANPMGGCLPMLMQIPIFFAIYRVLLNAVELQGAEWALWITDLSIKDPYFVLPILMGASMWYQQKLTPNTMTDPLQQKIFQWLPVVMTIFFLTFPAGLVLYWLVNNLFTIAQQFIINSAYEKQKAAKAVLRK
ncbi:MAG: Inner membrane protein translocase component YidC, long form [uncultured Sulfurovum sp.]|uniref:Membrane protein insertase YidC n=1 Tax=uncultured Sulfurovum sp. TaxID=269237 RepID=A0A6S6T6J6_9BACT|nr:MAG: Inner membrane protein translocase component YidC, long form [uncultured Sulfurovum sp.]